MKKCLLSISFGLIAILTNAQVVFNVQSPASLAGNYAITYSDPAGGWGSPDMLDPANSVSGNLVIVDDGTSADSLGCNDLINAAQIAGNIAVVYRGSCQFGTKAFKAQNAGAIAVVIINNAPGDPIGMAPGDDGANVTIPVVMLTQIDGAGFRASIDGGSTVSVFIGNKFGLYETDLGFTKDRILLPNPNTMHSKLAFNATEHNFKVGAWIFNYGNLDQTNASLSANVVFNGSSVYSENVILPTINSGDTILQTLPDFALATYPEGTYTLTYTLSPASTDEYDADNSYSVDFYVSSGVFSYVKLNNDGLPAATTGYRTSAATSTFTSCIHFRNPNASRLEAGGIYFSATTNTSASLLNQQFTATAYQWDDQFTDLNDPNAAVTSILDVAQGDYTFQDSTLELKTVYAEFGSPLTLIDNQRYLFCVSTFDVNTYIGYGDIDYTLTLDTYLQPLFPIQTDAGFDIIGFGGESAALGVRMYVPGTSNITTETKSNISIYPNPTKNVLNITGADLTKYETIELKDQLGRTISTWKVNSNATTLDVSKFANGNYILVLNGSNGVSINNVQINN